MQSKPKSPDGTAAKHLPASQADFVAETVLKRDIFSETVAGHLASDPSVKVVLRRLDGVPWYAAPIAQFLARREVRGLKAVQGIEGVPILLAADRAGILRVWSHGTPLHLAKPGAAQWYSDAQRLLREMRARGVCHNDIAKPQNWLMTPQGKAAVIDFQLASVHRRKGKLFRIAAREDLRHMLKQKRAYAPHLLTPSEKRILAQKSLPSRIWMATGKKLYNFITRRLMNWSDGEGSENRVENHGPALRRAYLEAGAREVGLAAYAMSAGGVGLYAFVEGSLDPIDLPVLENGPDLIQMVEELPRRPDGSVWQEILALIATNRIDEVDQLIVGDIALAELVKPIVQNRLNLTDRRLR